MPSQPCAASFCQNSSVTAAGSAIRRRTNCVSHSLSKNLRALSRSSSCSSVNPMSMLAARFGEAVCLKKRGSVPIPALKNDFVVLDTKETAAPQAEQVLPFKDRPLAVLEDVFGDADHFRSGEIRGEHLADRGAAFHRFTHHLVIDGVLGVKRGHLVWITAIERLDPGDDQLAGTHHTDSPAPQPFGRPRTRSPMILRWISLVPPAIVYCRAPSTRWCQRAASGTASVGASTVA